MLGAMSPKREARKMPAITDKATPNAELDELGNMVPHENRSTTSTRAQGQCTMRLLFFLLPLNYNDGAVIGKPRIKEVLDQVVACFGGVTCLGVANGGWQNGKRARWENMMPVVVLIDGQVSSAELKPFFETVARHLKQELIFYLTFDVTNGSIA